MKLYEYIRYMVYFTLLALIILIDISVIVFIIAYFLNIPFAIEFNEYLMEYGGSKRGVPYSKGAVLLSLLLIQIPVIPYLLKKLKAIKL